MLQFTSALTKAWRKYSAVSKINFQSRAVYIGEQVISSLFLIVILYVALNLWTAALGTDEHRVVDGFSVAQILWYTVATEVIVLGLPRIHSILSSEIRSGEIAIRLNKPFNYLLFHYFSALGESFFRAIIICMVGSAVCYGLVGPIDFQWHSVFGLAVVFVTSHILNFLYGALIGVFAFWTEDVTGLFFVLDRAKWILGGLFYPIEYYPESLKAVLSYLPFTSMLFEPARLAVHFSWMGFADVMLKQFFWGVVLFGIVSFIFSRGMRVLTVQGG